MLLIYILESFHCTWFDFGGFGGWGLWTPPSCFFGRLGLVALGTEGRQLSSFSLLIAVAVLWTNWTGKIRDALSFWKYCLINHQFDITRTRCALCTQPGGTRLIFFWANKCYSAALECNTRSFETWKNKINCACLNKPDVRFEKALIFRSPVSFCADAAGSVRRNCARWFGRSRELVSSDVKRVGRWRESRRSRGGAVSGARRLRAQREARMRFVGRVEREIGGAGSRRRNDKRGFVAAPGVSRQRVRQLALVAAVTDVGQRFAATRLVGLATGDLFLDHAGRSLDWDAGGVGEKFIAAVALEVGLHRKRRLQWRFVFWLAQVSTAHRICAVRWGAFGRRSTEWAAAPAAVVLHRSLLRFDVQLQALRFLEELLDLPSHFQFAFFAGEQGRLQLGVF